MEQIKQVKKKNGFTLVELLAVIVILAIVVGITLVTVLPALKDSRQNAFELTAQTAADFVEKQYQLSLIGSNTTLTTWGKEAVGATPAEKIAFNKTTITAAGLKPNNYVYGTYYINSTTGRACVELYASTNASAAAFANNLNSQMKAGEYHDATPGPEITLPVGPYGAGGIRAEITHTYSAAKSSGC